MGDPLTASALIPIAEQLLRVGTEVLQSRLSQRMTRWRVAWRACKIAQQRGIGISFRALSGWLAREDTKLQLASGAAVSIESARASLANRVAGVTAHARAVSSWNC